MPNRKREGEAQKRVHVWLFERDIERIHSLYGKRIGPSRVLRTVLRNFLNNIEERARAQGKSIDKGQHVLTDESGQEIEDDDDEG